MKEKLNVEQVVQARYAAEAQQPEAALCCPVTYDSRYLAILPQEILDKDYGCGDPTPYLRPGKTVLDLGCGTGKICYIAAQIVGPSGRLIGIDMTPEMLAVAEKYRHHIGEQLGFHNVEFRRGRIQDLRIDLDAIQSYLHRHPVASLQDLQEFEAFRADQRATRPLVADESVDVVVSNCVLNLGCDEDKPQLFAEIFRVLRNGGRALISDIVSDEPVPPHLKSVTTRRALALCVFCPPGGSEGGHTPGLFLRNSRGNQKVPTLDDGQLGEPYRAILSFLLHEERRISDVSWCEPPGTGLGGYESHGAVLYPSPGTAFSASTTQ